MPTSPWKRSVAAGLFLVGPGGAIYAQAPPPPVFSPSPGPMALPGPVATGYPSQFGPAAVVGPAQPCVRKRPSIWSRCKYTLEDCFLGRPEEFDAPPLGMSVSMHYETHIANGVAARMTLYDYDFYRGGDQLNVRGKDRVRQIAALMGSHPFPVVVERMPYAPGLADARRRAVLAELAAVMPRVPVERVVIGPPIAVPLRGVEAELVYQNLLLQTGTAGAYPGTGAGPGTGTTSAGSGSRGGGFPVGPGGMGR
ncbi:MAG TPA: hypothetical protein VFG68_11865 [Fimbriiglobus sp.]|nr:hypothetical protein [Fimbriiglobus sp.]